MINIAIIGSGYWGINYVRVFSEIHDSKIVLVCDSNEDRLRGVRERYQLIGTSTNWEEAIASRPSAAAFAQLDYGKERIARVFLVCVFELFVARSRFAHMAARLVSRADAPAPVE